MKSLIIDNYDSFTYNLYQLLAEINHCLPMVITNDQLSWSEINQANFDNIIISPGPGNPTITEDFGVCQDILIKAEIPVLGVCLGHQGLGYYYGGKVGYAPEPMHGRISTIYHHDNDFLFQNIPLEFSVVRYHSLILLPSSLSQLEEIAWTKKDHLIMAIRHKNKPFWGVQFHPESICTEYGRQLLINFKHLTEKFWQNKATRNNFKSFPYLININNQNNVTKRMFEKSLTRILIPPNPPSKGGNLRKVRQKVPLNKGDLGGSETNQTSSKISDQNIQNINNSAYQIYSKKLDFWLDSEIVFRYLYQQSDYSFWLDSSMIAEGLSRFSFMGDNQGKHSFVIQYQVDKQQIKVINRDQVTISEGDIFDFLDDYLTRYSCKSEDLPFNFNGGFVGYFGYELKSLCNQNHQNLHQSGLPDSQLIFVDRFVAFDHLEGEIYLVYLDNQNYQNNSLLWFTEIEEKLTNILNNDNVKSILEPIQINNGINKNINFNNEQILWQKLTKNKEQYLSDIQTCLEQIRQGESYEICLTNQINLPTIQETFLYYSHLRKTNPAPYSAYLKLRENIVICSSPERFLSLDKDGWLESKPIKGTCKRGENLEEDLLLKDSLKGSEKEQAENLMIVDLLRNDLGKVCEIGTVYVPKLMAIETYSTVHQMVSTIRGKIRAEMRAIDCIKASFPGGSMTGAPKKRTMEIIDQLETSARGIYSGSIGFLALNNTLDLNIVIRTAVITPEKISIGVGGAITSLSDGEKEFTEIILKAKALINVLSKYFLR